MLLVALTTAAISGCQDSNIKVTPVSATQAPAGNQPVSNQNTMASSIDPAVFGNSTVIVSGSVSASATTYSSGALWSNGVMKQWPAMVVAAVIAVDSDVYFTGYTTVQTGQVPTLWKNGVATVLENMGATITTSLCVSGTDVYVGGYDNMGGVYWKNGTLVRLPLTDSITYSIVKSISVSGGDIYTAGTAITANYHQWAAYWKNGQVNYLKTSPALSNGGQFSFATGIVAKGSDVYASGMMTGSNFSEIAVTWKNGVAMKLDSGSASANSVFVFSDDVYVGGFNNQGGVFWKNGVATNVGFTTSVNSVYVTGSGVYLAGYADDGQGWPHAAIFKNGLLIVLPGSTDAGASGIAVVDKDTR